MRRPTHELSTCTTVDKGTILLICVYAEPQDGLGSGQKEGKLGATIGRYCSR